MASHQNRLSDPGKESRLKQHLPVVPVFDGYRALAILGVVVLHIILNAGYLDEVNPFSIVVQGFLGQAVEVLFVVSGFVVFLPTVARQGDFGSVGSYFVRRAARLIPAYWMILVICLLLLWLVPPDGIDLPGLGSVVIHFIGAQVLASGLIPGFVTGFGLDGPVWTLSVEIGFYLVLPLIAGIYFRRPLAGLLVAALITILWKVLQGHIDWVPSLLGTQITIDTAIRWSVTGVSQLPNWAFSFAAGMTGAWAYVKAMEDRDRWAGLIRIVQPLSLICLIAAGLYIGNHTTEFAGVETTFFTRNASFPSLSFTFALTCLMISTALRPGWTQRPFDNPPIRELGDISYGIYLFHSLVIVYAISIFDLGPGAPAKTLVVLALTVIPLSIAYGYLSARFLEQPIRRWARRFGRRS